MRTDTLAGSVLILILATLIQRSVGFGRGVLFCRWLSPETLGQWEMAYSFLLLFAPLAVLGVPGSFGRYLEHYRQRRQLGIFISRTTLWTVVCTVLAVSMLLIFPQAFSRLVFGDFDSTDTIQAIALCAAAVILHHTLTSLLTALRLFRVVTVMNFVQSLLFAALTLSLLSSYPHVLTIVGGYGVACFIASVGALLYVWPGLKCSPEPYGEVPHLLFWTRLLKFAFFVWVTNLLSHLFAVVDRAMILHCGNMNPAVALEQVGHYHSSRIVPLLLVSFADLLSGLILPHLSHDWELGKRADVSRTLNLTVKLSGLGMHVVGICVLLFGPFMFGTILQGRYANGLAVLPWTLAGCVLASIYVIAQTYLWCAEHARLATVPLAAGLVVNILLNLALVPHWGLKGAVVATAISTVASVVVLFLLSHRQGLTFDPGIWLTSALPISLGFGVAASVVCLTGTLVLTLASQWVIRPDERHQLLDLYKWCIERVKRSSPKWVPTGTSSSKLS